ncbi:peptide deformylase [Nocardia sp. NPDC052566]|uniref:peptide deformylase n=1 Tax=Nocardia sp. NPDC052566 TaxID=3364330 RepID=UPI0037C841A7
MTTLSDLLVPMGSALLRESAAPVALAGADVNRDRLCENLVRVLRVNPDAIAVAAPQIGVPLRVVALRAASMCQIRALSPDHPDVVIHFNPRITEASTDTEDAFEGCLSVPRITGVVARPVTVHYTAQLANSRVVTATLHGRAARVVAHEIDHLDGILFVDRAPSRSLCTHGVANRAYACDVRSARACLGF